MAKKLIYKMRELAEAIGLCPTTIRRLVKAGKLSPLRTSKKGHLLFPAEQVEKLLEKLK